MWKFLNQEKPAWIALETEKITINTYLGRRWEIDDDPKPNLLLVRVN